MLHKVFHNGPRARSTARVKKDLLVPASRNFYLVFLFHGTKIIKTSQVSSLHVAGPSINRRRSAFLVPPATQIGPRSKRASRVRRFLQTCDTLLRHLRHFAPSSASHRGHFFQGPSAKSLGIAKNITKKICGRTDFFCCFR